MLNENFTQNRKNQCAKGRELEGREKQIKDVKEKEKILKGGRMEAIRREIMNNEKGIESRVCMEPFNLERGGFISLEQEKERK